MWELTLQRLAVLRSLDKQLQAFGAPAHKYELGNPISDAVIAQVEDRLGPLPSHLRAFYAEFGNGGAGPGYGVVPIDRLEHRGGNSIGFSHQGCGYELCVASGDSNAVLEVDDFGQCHDLGASFFSYYNDWLEGEIGDFIAIETRIAEGMSMTEIHEFAKSTLKRHDAHDVVSSIINAEKPPELFGTPSARIYHGATQFPWYEAQLDKFRGGPNRLAGTESRSWWQFWKPARK